MKPHFDAFAFAILGGAAQAALVALALCGGNESRPRPARSHARLMLCGLAACLAVVQAGSALLHTRWLLAVPHLGQLHVPFQFLLAPFCLFYVRSLAGSAPFSRRSALLHVAPAALMFVVLLPFYLQGAAAKASYLLRAMQAYPLEWRVRQAVLLIQIGGYLACCGWLAQRAALAGRRRNWLAGCTAAMALTWIAAVVRFVSDYSVRSVYVVPSFLSAFIFALAYAGLRSPQILTEAPPSAALAGGSGALLAAVRRLMEQEQLFLDPALTLNSLASRLDTNTHRLSESINSGARQSFTDFVNGYRVAEAQRRLTAPGSEHLTIEAIGAECGFGSKTAFYQAFRKVTGHTPAAARKAPDARSES